MRLRSLRLENYRRHRLTEVEFPDGVTAVLGRNGSGKTSLLEALGFVLFGPPATRTHKGLLRHEGAAPGDAVRVEAAIEVGGQALRVVRELRGRNLTPSGTLEVDGVALVPAGAGSAEAVTAEMVKRLGMDREGFFTTVVARQKELSRLADHRPAERKRMILGMLGVDQVDAAIGRGRMQRRGAEERVHALRDVLGDRKALQQTLQDAEDAVREARGRTAEAEAKWGAAKEGLAEAATALEQAASMHEARREAERDLAARRREAGHCAERLREAEARHRAAKEAAARSASLSPAAARLPEAEEALEQARQIQQAARRRQDAVVAVQRQKKALQDREAVLAALAPSGADAEEGPRNAAAVEEARRALQDAAHRRAVLEARVEELRRRHRRLAGLGSEAPCPTCERPLGDHLPQILAEAEAAYEEAHGGLKAARREADVAQRRLVAAEATSQEAGRRLEEAQRREQERVVQEEAVALERGRLVELEEAVPEDPGPPPATEPLAKAVREAREAHEARLRAQALAEEAPAAEEAAAAAAGACEKAGRAEAEAAAALEALPDTAPALEAARAANEEAVRRERGSEREVHGARGLLRLAEERAVAARERLEEDARRRRRLRGLEEEARYWVALAGPRGGGLLDRFRDHLVHRVGPAIAEEASRLLDRFTDGRYTEVLLDEDYEVFVTDGGRSYTLDRFSGGEADLVHLALRLAVSRLLAERGGGAEVRFLALDEVFGSLDAEHRHLVVAALEQLSSLYSQVLLVTHLDALQDALDQALLVEDRDGEAVVAMRTG